MMITMEDAYHVSMDTNSTMDFARYFSRIQIAKHLKMEIVLNVPRDTIMDLENVYLLIVSATNTINIQGNA